eukprot:gene9682-1888_t
MFRSEAVEFASAKPNFRKPPKKKNQEIFNPYELSNEEIMYRWSELSLGIKFDEFLNTTKGYQILSKRLEKVLKLDYLLGYSDIKAALSFFEFSVPLEETKKIVDSIIHSFLDDFAVYEVVYDFKDETQQLIKNFCSKPEENLQKMEDHLKKISNSFVEVLRSFYQQNIIKSGDMREFVIWYYGTIKKKSSFGLTNYYNSFNTVLNNEAEWKTKTRHPMKVVSSLLQFLLNSMRLPIYWAMDIDTFEPKFQRDKFLSKMHWSQFNSATSELSQINLNTLDQNEYIPFFINLYNLMVLDATISSEKVISIKKSDCLRKYKYIINGMSFSVDDILNGILLTGSSSTNRSKYAREKIPKSDPRSKFVIPDLQKSFLFALADMTLSSPKIMVLDPKDYEFQTLTLERDFLKNQIKRRDGEFILPFMFSNFSILFKKEKLTENKSIVEFISKEWKVYDSNNQPIQFLSDDMSYHAVLNEETMEKLMKSKKYILKNEDEKYYGELKNSVKHGNGEVYYQSGEKYKGMFVDDVREGEGVFVCTEYKYFGSWKNDQKDGWGIMIFFDGTIYEGNFKTNKKNGEGKLVLPNGDTISGKWKDDEIENATYSKGKINNISKLAISLFKEKMNYFTDDRLSFGLIKKKDLVPKMNVHLLNQSLMFMERDKYHQSSKFHSQNSLDRESIIEELCKNQLKSQITNFVETFQWSYQSVDKPRIAKPQALDDFYDFLNTLYYFTELFLLDKLTNQDKGFLKNYVLKLVYKPLFEIYKKMYHQKDFMFKYKILSLSSVTFKSFGIKEKLVNKEKGFKKAIEVLKKISDYISATEKFDALVETSHELLLEIEEYCPTAEVGADDLFPIHLYIYIMAKIPNIYSLFKFLNDFLDDIILDSEASYRFTNFELTLEFIEKLDPNIKDENSVLVPVSVFEGRLQNEIRSILKSIIPNPCLLWISGLLIEIGSIAMRKKKGERMCPCCLSDKEIDIETSLTYVEPILATIGLSVVFENDRYFIQFVNLFPPSFYFQMASCLESALDDK